MSYWNEYETSDIFGNEDSEINHLLNGEVLESVSYTESHKKPRYEGADDARSNIYREGSATEAALPMNDATLLLSTLKEGSSNILHPSLSLISENAAAVLAITKCSTGVLDCHGDKIATKSVRKDENGTGKNTFFLDTGKRADVPKNFFVDNSVDNLVGLLTKEQMNGEGDLPFLDYPSSGRFEDLDKLFRNRGSTFVQGSTVSENERSWFSSSSHGLHSVEDTLQSVVLSSVSASHAFNNESSAHVSRSNILPGIKPSSISSPSSTVCSSLPLYTDAGRKGMSLISELAYEHVGIAGRSSTTDQVCYGNECRNPDMIFKTLKERSTTKGKTIIPTLGSTVQSSCGFIHNFQNQELQTPFLPTPQPLPLQAISKKSVFLESLTSSCLHSYSPQSHMSDILKSAVVKSSELSDYVTFGDPLCHALPGSFPIPSMPMEKNKKLYVGPQFPAAWLMDKPLELLVDKSLERHAEESDCSLQEKYKTEDVVEDVKEAAVNIGSSTIHDNSCVTNPIIDDMSVKAANIQQLQVIMDQLGVRTKLCFRDSLYRLARSAEQSHCYDSAYNASRAGSPVPRFQNSKDLKRSPGFVDLPTNTNEIERAVAYLLFHKYIGSGTGTADDSMWLRAPIHIDDPLGKCKEPYQPAS